MPVPEDMKDKLDQYYNELVEKIVEFDDALTEKYLGGEEISLEELKKLYVKELLLMVFIQYYVVLPYKMLEFS